MRRVGDNPDVQFDRDNPLGSWRKIVERIEREERRRLGLPRTAVVRPRDLVNEVIRLADPNAVRGRDVVIPAGREDLVRTWVSARLSGRGVALQDRLALAREIAPSPVESVDLAWSRRKRQRYKHVSPFEAAVTNAAKKAFKDTPPLGSDNG